MKKILFVCLGNICRSPLAHGIAQQIARDRGLNLIIDSAGTSNWHVGEAPCTNSIKVAQLHSVDISTQQSRTITKNDITQFEYVIAMDSQNKTDMKAFGFKNVHLLGDFGGFKGSDVPDPWFFEGTDVMNSFEKVYTMVQTCVEELLRKIENGSL